MSRKIEAERILPAHASSRSSKGPQKARKRTAEGPRKVSLDDLPFRILNDDIGVGAPSAKAWRDEYGGAKHSTFYGHLDSGRQYDSSAMQSAQDNIKLRFLVILAR